MADIGIKVSDEGTDVFDAADKNLSLKTGFTLLKVFDSGTLTLTGSVGDFTEVTHNLGYVPQFLVYVLDTGPDPDAAFLATGDLGVAVARADTTKLYVQKDTNKVTAFYYIFYEPADTGSEPTITPSSDLGIKVSKDGIDVKTAGIFDQTFNSEKNSLKISSDGEETSTANGTRTVTVAHGLGVIPLYFVFFEVENSGNWFSNYTESHLHAGARVEANTDDTNLNIEITTTSSQTVKIKYFIFVDPGN